jgi:hypothetical protein
MAMIRIRSTPLPATEESSWQSTTLKNANAESKAKNSVERFFSVIISSEPPVEGYVVSDVLLPSGELSFLSRIQMFALVSEYL